MQFSSINAITGTSHAGELIRLMTYSSTQSLSMVVTRNSIFFLTKITADRRIDGISKLDYKASKYDMNYLHIANIVQRNIRLERRCYRKFSTYRRKCAGVSGRSQYCCLQRRRETTEIYLWLRYIRGDYCNGSLSE